jgi:hypothetical protein
MQLEQNQTVAQLTCQIYTECSAVPDQWDQTRFGSDVFLSKEYLQVLEAQAPDGMDFFYTLFFENARPVGKAYFQMKHFDASQHILEEKEEKTEICFFTALSKWARKWVSKRVKSDILVCGNLLSTGEHGFVFDSTLVSELDAQLALERAITEICQSGDRKFSPFVLIKDVSPERLSWKSHFAAAYAEFEIQPNMVIDLEWSSFQHYLDSMTTRYRTRYKRAVKKLGDMAKRQMNNADVSLEKAKMQGLYRSIATNVGFNMVDLNENYIAALLHEMPDRFEVHGYYLNGNLEAFYTLMDNGTELEAHFLGFNRDLNHDRQIYLNILYDIVAHGIDRAKKRIVFARTALEIKSSVGAVPEQLYCYLKHSSSLPNKLAPHMVEYLKPKEIWQQRHPFRDDASDKLVD